MDIQADNGLNLYVLEANLNTDLAAARAEKTNITYTGLQNDVMEYDDLIRSMFADQVDLLFCKRQGTATEPSTAYLTG